MAAPVGRQKRSLNSTVSTNPPGHAPLFRRHIDQWGTLAFGTRLTGIWHSHSHKNGPDQWVSQAWALSQTFAATLFRVTLASDRDTMAMAILSDGTTESLSEAQRNLITVKVERIADLAESDLFQLTARFGGHRYKRNGILIVNTVTARGQSLRCRRRQTVQRSRWIAWQPPIVAVWIFR